MTKTRALAEGPAHRRTSDATPPGDAAKGAVEVALRDAVAHQHDDESRGELSAWQHVQLARHPDRPYTLDYVRRICVDFVELHGDRHFGDDPAIVGGPALLGPHGVMIVGYQKGRNTRENVRRNFGMAHPEGLRKAQRLFALAESLALPLVAFVDTPGAAVSIAGEEHGQAEAIARSLALLVGLRVPIVSVVIGEGNSGGALALGVADRFLMLEHAYCSVAAPEAAAAIMWHSAARAPEAAAAMGITAHALLQGGLIDGIIPEPPGGAHRDYNTAAVALRDAVVSALDGVLALPVATLLAGRYDKYRRLGPFAWCGDYVSASLG